MSAVVPLPKDLLLGYQRALLRLTAKHKVTVVEKSRRIGATWAVAADAVLTAAAARGEGGQNVFYMGTEHNMTREFVQTCAMWARSFNSGASELEEFLFRDDAADKDIQAFRIRFASGFRIEALVSKPRALRGQQGYLILDEAAFHDGLAEVIKAALAFLVWGGKLLIISTHDGVDNAFNLLIQDILAGRKPYGHLKVTLDDALEDGLFRRICETTGQTWTLEAEKAWRDDIVAQFDEDAANEELFCVPRASGGKYLSRILLESRAVECPVVHWTLSDGAFVDLPDAQRTAAALQWCEEHLGSILAELLTDRRHYLGEDFARNGDLTDLWIYQLDQKLRRDAVLLVELRNVPFREQETVLQFICDRLPRFSGAALDARGNGQYLAERARQLYGAVRVKEVQLTSAFYAEQWPRFKAALEDDDATIPRSSDVVDDFRTVEVVRGVPVIAERTKSASGQRHGDSAIAGLLAFYASAELDGGEVTVDATAEADAAKLFPEYDQVSESEFYQ